MLGFVLFVRTLAVGAILIMSALYSGFWLVHILRAYNVVTSRVAEGFIMLAVLALFWFIYRRYFQQHITINDDSDV